MSYQDYTVGQVQSIIATQATQAAEAQDLSPSQTQEAIGISEATAQQESGFNPYAIGDGSYGIFQDETQGGEGSGYSPQQLFDPTTSASISIPTIVAELKANPTASPGAIAVAAQRPADLAQAGRIEGMTPAALTLLAAHARKSRPAALSTGMT